MGIVDIVDWVFRWSLWTKVVFMRGLTVLNVCLLLASPARTSNSGNRFSKRTYAKLKWWDLNLDLVHHSTSELVYKTPFTWFSRIHVGRSPVCLITARCSIFSIQVFTHCCRLPNDVNISYAVSRYLDMTSHQKWNKFNVIFPLIKEFTKHGF